MRLPTRSVNAGSVAAFLRRPALWVGGLLLAEVVFFHWKVLFVPGYVIPWDLRYFHLPHAAYIASCLARGELPLWDPFTYCGRPFAANIQVQLFYPPRWVSIGLHLWLGWDLLYCLELELIAHVFLAGLLTWLFLREFGLSPTAAAAGATAYQLGPFFSSQAQHIGAVSAAGWLPLTWLAAARLARNPSASALLLWAFGLALTIFCGLPAMTVVAAFSSWWVAFTLARPWRQRLRITLLAALAALLAGLLAGIQLLPTIELNFQSIARYRADWLGTGGGLPVQSLVSLVFPNFYSLFDLSRYRQPWEPTFLYTFSGWLTLALAILAALRWRDWLQRVFALSTIVFCLAMLGDATPLGRWILTSLPPLVRAGLHPEFMLAAFSLALSSLAAFGLRTAGLRTRWQWIAVTFIAAELLLVSSHRPMNLASVKTEPGVTAEAFQGSRETLDVLRRLAYSTKPAWRLDTIDDTTHWAMTAPLTGLPSANGNDPMALERLIQVRLAFCVGQRWGAWYQVSDPSSVVLDFLGVRFLLSRSPVPEPQLAQWGLRHIADLPGRKLYENPGAMPRFFFVSRVLPVPHMAAAAARIRDSTFNPREVAIVEGWPVDQPVEFRLAQLPQLALESYTANRIVLRVDTPAPVFLVSSEAHYPGWRAWVDGERVPLYYTNVAFRGLVIPRGNHRLILEFRPVIFFWGALISAIGWLWAIALAKGPFWQPSRACS